MGWKKGNVVMEALPYAHVVMKVYNEQKCNFCLTSSTNLKRCVSCKKLWYCSMRCQKDDWKIHKTECPVLKRVPDLPTDSLRLYLRLVLQHQLGKSTVKLDKSESPCLRVFNDLESHCKEIKADKVRWELFLVAAHFIRAYAHDVFVCPSEEIMLDIFGKMVINTFTLTDEMLQDVGVGVYNSPSILDHSCCANAIASFEGRRLTVRLIADIPTPDLSQVFLSYVDPLALTIERQEQLENQYYFTCSCDRCKDQTLDDLMLSLENSNQDEVNKVRACLESLETMKNDSVDAALQVDTCDKCLESVHLSPTNIYLVRLIGKAFDEAINVGMWKEAVRYGQRNLLPYQRLYPPYSPSLGYLYASLGKIYVFLDQAADARPLLTKALEIFIMTQGEGHTLTRQVMELIQQCQMELAAR